MRDPVSNQRWKRPEEQPPGLSAYLHKHTTHACMHWHLSPPLQARNIHYKLCISPVKIFLEDMMEITTMDLSRHDGGTDLGNALEVWSCLWFTILTEQLVPSRIHVSLSAIKGCIPQDQDQCKQSAYGKVDFTYKPKAAGNNYSEWEGPVRTPHRCPPSTFIQWEFHVSWHSCQLRAETVSRREKCDISSLVFHWARPSW